MKPAASQTAHHLAATSLAGLIVGLITAFSTVGFIEAVRFLNDLLFVSAHSRVTLSGLELSLITIATLTIGGLVVGLIMQFGVDKKPALGPPDTIYAVQLHERLPPPVAGIWSTLASILSLGCGASVGQYGPLVYLGTLFGQLSNRLPLGLPNVRSMTIACGVAAAISTAFMAPIAALIFTHEVILRHYSLRMFTAVTVASACGYFVASDVFGRTPIFLIETDGSFHAIEFLLFGIEGVACGILAVLLMKSLQYVTKLSRQLTIPFAMQPMLAGFIVSLIALQVPEVLGAGEDVFIAVIYGNSYSADTLLLILVTKMLVTLICLGFGFAGGVIFPSMLIGALFGALFAQLIPELLLDSYSGVFDYAICGLAAMMSPVIGAPMAALLLVFELTHNYEITIAAMVTIVFSNLVASNWYGRSLYDHLLARRGIDLSQGREQAYLMHHKVSEHLTEALPAVQQDAGLEEIRQRMTSMQTASAIIVDNQQRYLGILQQQQIADLPEDTSLATIELPTLPSFDENTSIWEAMQVMRDYLGEAIAVVDSASGRYLGSIPEAVVIDAYLDASAELRREEHET